MADRIEFPLYDDFIICNVFIPVQQLVQALLFRIAIDDKERSKYKHGTNEVQKGYWFVFENKVTEHGKWDRDA